MPPPLLIFLVQMIVLSPLLPSPIPNKDTAGHFFHFYYGTYHIMIVYMSVFLAKLCSLLMVYFLLFASSYPNKQLALNKYFLNKWMLIEELWCIKLCLYIMESWNMHQNVWTHSRIVTSALGERKKGQWTQFISIQRNP